MAWHDDDAVALGHLHMWLRTRAVIRKPVTLASGAGSNYYIDGRRIALWSTSLRVLGQLLFNRASTFKPTAIGGPATAAIPLVAATLLEANRHGQELDGFYVRAAVKDHGLQNVIEGRELTAADKVVMLEDVVTTGGSLAQAVTAVRATGAAVVAIICMVDREAGAADRDWGGAAFQSLFTKSDLDL